MAQRELASTLTLRRRNSGLRLQEPEHSTELGCCQGRGLLLPLSAVLPGSCRQPRWLLVWASAHRRVHFATTPKKKERETGLLEAARHLA